MATKNLKAERIKKQMEERLKVYEEKNERYGDSFSLTFEQYGPISALTRMKDKMNRLENLILNQELDPKDETIIDTLMDLANYCDMTVEVMTRSVESVERKDSKPKKPRKKKKATKPEEPSEAPQTEEKEETCRAYGRAWLYVSRHSAA